MITTIRRGEIYQFATMDPAVLDEVRDIEWAADQGRTEPDTAQPGNDTGLVDAFRRLFGRSTH